MAMSEGGEGRRGRRIWRSALAAAALLAAGLGERPARAFDAQQFNPAIDPAGYFSVYSSRVAPKGRYYISLWYDFAKDPLILDLREFGYPGSLTGGGSTIGGGRGPGFERANGLLGFLDGLTRPVLTPTGQLIDPLDPVTNALLCSLLPITDPLSAPVVDPLQDCPALANAGGTSGAGGGIGFGGLFFNPGRIVLVDKMHTGHLVASYSVLDWLEVGFELPFAYIQSDFPGVEEGFGIDDMRVITKLQLLDSAVSPIGLALIPYGDFPLDDDDSRLTQNGEIDYGAIAVADYVRDRFRISLNGGYKVNDQPFDDDDETDEVTFGLGSGFLLFGNQPVLGRDESSLELLGEVFGASAESELFESEYSTPVEFLAGLRYWSPGGFQALLGGGRRITDGLNSPELRIVASVGYSWQPRPPAPPPPPAPTPPPPPPPPAKVVVTDEQLILLEPIYFDFDKATIKTVSYPILDEVVKVMNDRPDIKVRVEGHTDSRGSDTYNQKLSERRTQSVVHYLAEHGIDAGRLEARGFGESRPIAPNERDEGRAKNRRTEFHIVK